MTTEKIRKEIMSKKGATILVVDDHPRIRELICYALENEGFQTLEAGSKDEAISIFEENYPDLVVLDIMMPSGEEGYEVLGAIRKQSEVPVIFLTSKPGRTGRIVGLKLGGDDYMSKEEGDFQSEFGSDNLVSKENLTLEELVSRVKNVLKRMNRTDDPDKEKSDTTNQLKYFDIQLGLDEHKAYLNEKEVSFTRIEFSLLETMMRNPSKVHTWEDLIDGVWGQHRLIENKLISGHINAARKKLKSEGRDPIEPVPGIGYRLVPPNSASNH